MDAADPTKYRLFYVETLFRLATAIESAWPGDSKQFRKLIYWNVTRWTQYNKFHDWAQRIFHFMSNHRFFVFAQFSCARFAKWRVDVDSYIRWPSAINFHFIERKRCAMYSNLKKSSRSTSSIFYYFCRLALGQMDFWINVIAFFVSFSYATDICIVHSPNRR